MAKYPLRASLASPVSGEVVCCLHLQRRGYAGKRFELIPPTGSESRVQRQIICWKTGTWQCMFSVSAANILRPPRASRTTSARRSYNFRARVVRLARAGYRISARKRENIYRQSGKYPVVCCRFLLVSSGMP